MKTRVGWVRRRGSFEFYFGLFFPFPVFSQWSFFFFWRAGEETQNTSVRTCFCSSNHFAGVLGVQNDLHKCSAALMLYLKRKHTQMRKRCECLCFVCLVNTVRWGKKKSLFCKASRLHFCSFDIFFLSFHAVTVFLCYLVVIVFFFSFIHTSFWQHEFGIPASEEKKELFFLRLALSHLFFFYFVLVPFFFSAILDAARSSYSSFLSCSCFTY